MASWLKRILIRGLAAGFAVAVGGALVASRIVYARQGYDGVKKMFENPPSGVVNTVLPITFAIGFAIVIAYEGCRWLDGAVKRWLAKKTAK